ncbi:MAG: hypothetical protein AB1750_06040 [Chloroflexota bacterium]
MQQNPPNEPIGETPPGAETDNHLKELYSNDASVRRNKVLSLREQRASDSQVVDALKHLVANDPAGSVRKEAKKSLNELGIQPPPLGPELAKKRRDFWIGVGLYFGLNLALRIFQYGVYALLLLGNTYTWGQTDWMFTIVNLLPWVINIGLIIFLAFKRPQMALGMLAGFGIALLLVVCLLALWIGYCFVTGTGIA